MRMIRRVLILSFFLFSATWAIGEETFNLWNGPAPGETAETEAPVIELWKPGVTTTDACVIVCPGGAYMGLAYDHEGKQTALYYNSRGVTAVLLKYRVPRREGLPKHLPAWQDAQRAIRFVRAHAQEWKINPEKIGITGFSAGGHLTLMAATTSQTPAYEPTDDLDRTVPCHVNFAIPVYPAYVLEDGADGWNTEKGNDSPMVGDFAFDEKTPPMCLIHGDADEISAMGSVAVYQKLRKMDIPAELHIYAKVKHGFGASPQTDPDNRHEGVWLDAAYEWMRAMEF